MLLILSLLQTHHPGLKLYSSLTAEKVMKAASEPELRRVSEFCMLFAKEFILYRMINVH